MKSIYSEKVQVHLPRSWAALYKSYCTGGTGEAEAHSLCANMLANMLILTFAKTCVSECSELITKRAKMLTIHKYAALITCA